MQTASRIIGDLRRYWPLYLVMIVGTAAMYLGVVRIDEEKWLLAWLGGVGVPWAAAATHVKRRIERRPASGEDHPPR